jgi:hypothetical protein
MSKKQAKSEQADATDKERIIVISLPKRMGSNGSQLFRLYRLESKVGLGNLCRLQRFCGFWPLALFFWLFVIPHASDEHTSAQCHPTAIPS